MKAEFWSIIYEPRVWKYEKRNTAFMVSLSSSLNIENVKDQVILIEIK
jgi:hypothetical protein